MLSADDQAELPCIAIPDAIAITQPVANAKLLELQQAGLAAAAELSAEMQVALFLASEKALGTCSVCDSIATSYDNYLALHNTSNSGRAHSFASTWGASQHFSQACRHDSSMAASGLSRIPV